MVDAARLLVSIAAVAWCVGQPVAARAQVPDPLPNWELTAYVGGAHSSPVGTHLGAVPDRDHFFVGLHLTANLIRRERWSVGWAPEVVPLLLVTNNPTYQQVEIPEYGVFYFPDGAKPVYGFAVSPIGVEGQLRVSTSWRLYAAGAAGIAWFTRDVPVPGALSDPFTVEWGGGAIWQFGKSDALRAGYKFHHLSNAYRSEQNPGLDANVVLVGWTRRLGR